MAAAMGGHTHCVRILLDQKCDVNSANSVRFARLIMMYTIESIWGLSHYWGPRQ